MERSCIVQVLQPNNKCPLIPTMSGGNKKHQSLSTLVKTDNTHDFKAALNTVTKGHALNSGQGSLLPNPESTASCSPSPGLLV